METATVGGTAMGIVATVAGTAIAAMAAGMVTAAVAEAETGEGMAIAAAIPEIAPAGTPPTVRDPLPRRQARHKARERKRPKLPMARSMSVTRTASLKPCEAAAIS